RHSMRRFCTSGLHIAKVSKKPEVLTMDMLSPERLNQSVAVDEEGTRIADFRVLDLLNADTEQWQVRAS
ncbi:hypothetical protein MAR_012405, partial [Mya arenaria]